MKKRKAVKKSDKLHVLWLNITPNVKYVGGVFLDPDHAHVMAKVLEWSYYSVMPVTLKNLERTIKKYVGIRQHDKRTK